MFCEISVVDAVEGGGRDSLSSESYKISYFKFLINVLKKKLIVIIFISLPPKRYFSQVIIYTWFL